MSRKRGKEHIRKIQSSSGSYFLSIPIKLMRDFGWKERQKITVKKYGKDKLIVADWKPRARRSAKRKRAFTLIELLVVIAIIGVMATVIVVSFGGIREKSRDARRLSDMNELAKALGTYYIDNNQFPAFSDPIVLTGDDALSTALEEIGVFDNTPIDPLHPQFTYVYTSADDAARYSLTFCLETEKFPPYTQGCDNESRGE